jgi:hypothetical protein
MPKVNISNWFIINQVLFFRTVQNAMSIIYFTDLVIFCVPSSCLRNLDRDELHRKFTDYNDCSGGLPVEYVSLDQIMNIAVIIIVVS